MGFRTMVISLLLAIGLPAIVMAGVTVVYVDGNNNRYTVVQQGEGAVVTYSPIRAAESSSGEYDGGDPWSLFLSAGEGRALVDLLKAAAGDKAQQEVNRSMGSGTVILPGNRAFHLAKDSKNKSAVERELRNLKQRRRPQAAGSRDAGP